MNTLQPKTPPQRQRGFTLIEMMIALLILSVGMLGLAAMQGRGQMYNQQAYVRTQVSMLAYELMDRMRVNGPEFSAGSYAVDPLPTPGTEPDCDASLCDTAQLVTYDLARWNQMVQNTLPNAIATVALGTGGNAANRYVISITWTRRESEMDDPTDTAQATQTMTWVTGHEIP